MPARTFLKDVAISHPAALRILEKYRLDYCCGGERSLAQACQEAGLDADAVQAELAQARTLPPEAPPWDWVSPSSLIRFILDNHHIYTRAELLRLETLLDKVMHVHGANHPELNAVWACFLALRDELLPHLFKEETILFPYIEALEKHLHEGGPPPAACFGSIENPIAQMRHEHETAGDLLKQLRRLTQNFAPPPDACLSYRTAYQGLQAFETDLMRHIHLENNVLFPRARELAEAA
jgi:regulator of cell morphogenesis and NO signaling